MPRQRALVLVNSTAARIRRRAGLVTRLDEMARAGGAELRVTTRPEEMDEIARSLATRAELPLVVLVGGDGTHMAGVSAMARALGDRALPDFALCAAGTVNTTAAAWGSSGQALTDVGRALAGAPMRERATISVEDAEGTRRLGFIWGTGLVARFFELYDDAGGGLAVAAKLTARLALSGALGGQLSSRVLAPMPCTIDVDGRRADGDAFSLAVSSVLRDVGLGIRVTYRAGERDDRIHFVASRGRPAELASLLPRTLMGRGFDRPDDLDVLAAEVVVTGKDGVLPYILDGDTLRSDHVRLSVGRRLRVADLSRAIAGRLRT